jgi:acyl-CoA dehydrogenase
MLVGKELLERVQSASSEVLAAHAAEVDRLARFPEESFSALREIGLLAWFVPHELGGPDADLESFARIAGALGGACLSTAMNWVMHAHQVLILADHAGHVGRGREALEQVAREGRLIASVTTEPERGGDVLRANAPLVPVDEGAGSRLRLLRTAPTVSYGEQATWFLVTMRASRESPATDVRLVLLDRADGSVRVEGDWKALGMRGTRSVPMSFDVTVDPGAIIGGSFREIALRTMIPAAHVGWAAAWLGAARAALGRVIARERSRRTRDLASDHFLQRLGDMHLELDLGEALLQRVARRVDRMRAAGVDFAEYESVSHNLLVNELKVAAARISFRVVDGLMRLVGMAAGYLRESELELERVFRDLRSASLMLNDDRLLAANGRMLICEGDG